MKVSTLFQGLSLLVTTVVAAPQDQVSQRSLGEPDPFGLSELAAYWDNYANQNSVARTAAKPTVISPAGSVVGRSWKNAESFRGIPFAEPPVGQLRLRPPKRKESKLSNYDATTLFPPACPQMYVSSESNNLLIKMLDSFLDLPIIKKLEGQEDCLTLNVQRPAGTKAGDKLPVLFWIFGGGFQLGGTNTYDAQNMIEFANKQNQEFIFVAVNYRVAGFGFMPGKEIKADGSGNLGLLDQRMALEWVADNIEAYGGDPNKVTIWGESAGSISVFDQMALLDGKAEYKGKKLFRGAIMNSGSIVPAQPIDSPKAQAVYDQVVDRSGCKGKADTLACLREVPYDKFLKAVSSLPGIMSYQSVALSYLPRPDGKVLVDSPDKLARSGRYHAVPMIIGDQEDEGTIFTLFQKGLSSTSRVVDYLGKYFFEGASKESLRGMVDTYSSRLSEGSPFRTLFLNEWYSGFKRLSALLGDMVFTLARRLFLNMTLAANPDVPSWSYLASYGHGKVPFMGTFHGSDILVIMFGLVPSNAVSSGRTYYLNFVHNLDPNKGNTEYDNWPQWKENNDLMWFEHFSSNSILKDDFRSDSAEYLAKYSKEFYI